MAGAAVAVFGGSWMGPGRVARSYGFAIHTLFFNELRDNTLATWMADRMLSDWGAQLDSGKEVKDFWAAVPID